MKKKVLKKRKYKYKVVKMKSERSCSVPVQSVFSMRYKKGTAVHAVENTLGIMVFRLRSDAEKFIAWHLQSHYERFIIKKVIPIGKGRTPVKVSRRLGTRDLRNFYKESSKRAYEDSYYCASPIVGTICYPGVYVVD